MRKKLTKLSVLRALGLKDASKFGKNVNPKILIFEYFSKIPSEMNSTHPFYPILIPNTPYVKFFFFLFVRGSQKSKNIFNDI